MTGATAVERALAAAHLPLWLEAGAGLPWRGRTAPTAVAASVRAIAAALLDGAGGAAAMAASAGAVSAGLGMHNELRAPAVLLLVDSDDGSDGGRSACRDTVPLVQWEPSSAQESYELVRLAARLSLRAAMPVAVRLARSLLDADAPVSETPADPPPPPARYLRATGPHRTVGVARIWHRAKRERRLNTAALLVEQLCQQVGAEGPRAVVVAGHVPTPVAAAAWARRLPVLRLPAAWPLPEARVGEFLRNRDEVLVIESGAPSLWQSVAAAAAGGGLACRVRASDGQVADLDHVEAELSRFGGRRRAETEWPSRSPEEWRAAQAAAAGLPEDSDEPWPLFFARVRAASRSDASAGTPLVDALRAIGRSTIVVGEPHTPLAPDVAERLFDIEVAPGLAVDVADAIAHALSAPGIAPVLTAAVFSDAGLAAGDLIGATFAARARSDLLHIFLAGASEAIENQLRAGGLGVTVAAIDDPGLPSALAYAASRSGARALVCHGPQSQGFA